MAYGYVDPTQQRLTRAQWARYELVGLKPELDLDSLVLNWTDKRVDDLEAKGAITGLQLDRTIEGASTVTITLRDPNGRVFSERAKRMRERIDPKQARIRQAFKRDPVEVDEGWNPLNPPDVIGRAMEVEVDGVAFRLVQVRYQHASQELTLTFEDRVVYLLRRKRGAKRADRTRCTRAQFILSLLREVRAGGYRFVCPELLTTQRVDAGKARRALVFDTLASSASLTSGADTEQATGGGFAPSAKLTVKGVAADATQRRLMAGILDEASRLGASDTVMAACIACATQESGMGKAMQTTGNDDTGLYQQGRNWINVGDTADPAKTTRAFLTGAINGGGAKGWKQLHGSLKRTPGGFEAAIKKVQVSVGGYGQWQAEAERTVKAYRGTGAGSGEPSAGWTTKRYQFARNSDEDSWTAMQRLAQEVGWRLFVVGNSVYYMSEEALYRRRPRYEVRPDVAAVLDLSYDVDWGKTVSEASLTVALDRWGAPPGSVITLDGYGPPDGRWLVTQVTRDWFSPTATVSLKQPGKALLEPANERQQRATSASAGGGTEEDTSSAQGAAALYAKAKEISNRNYPYAWGGGHGSGGQPTQSHRGEGLGYDCSGYTGACLKAGGYGGSDPAVHSSAFGGLPGAKPGPGREFTVYYNSGHVWIKFEPGLGAQHDRADTSPYNSGPRGPHVRTGSRPTTGFAACHF